MKKLILTVIMMPALVFSALAPLPQSMREIGAILTSPHLREYLPQSSKINEITRVSDGYLIITDSQVLKVTVKGDKRARIGPKKFTLHFSPPMLIDQN